VDKPYLTVEEVAEMLQVSVETVRGYISKKKNPLPAFKLGREWRIPREDFDRWVREQMNRPDTQSD
jgi:excisionase family DNA binding protein